MKILFILLTTVLSLSAFAQKSSTLVDPNAKPRSLNGSFTAITVTDGIDLYLTAGTEESLAVSFADEKYEEKFKTEVEDGVLKIYFDNRGINYSDNNRRKLKAYVSFKTLEKLTASGGANVKLPTAISVNNFEMKFTSGSLFEGEVKAKEITLDQSSGSVVTISGSSDKITIEASSGAILKGYAFTTDYCNAKTSSGGEVRISVGKELSAKAHSGGGIHYKGTAIIKDIDISSGGVVKKV
ncbi:MAG: head GIN domain-containing protein [Ferruginibacter sp.]